MSFADEMLIRMRRAAFNAALATGDLAAIGPLLAPGAILLIGSDSAVIHGRKAQLAAWKREFAAAARLVYVRTPDTVIVAATEPLAMEHGRWTGAATGGARTGGSYAAKWRRDAAGWVIEAEIFVTLD